ncbi:MAG: molybdenum cofactor biosynthesis protein [delta proteobacterium ML8_D]|nr:MAG: molybdenum cofactor biosynthesis protein [delta proteobacterium ML8_D]
MYTAGVLTVSDSVFNGTASDESGPVIRRMLGRHGYNVLLYKTVPDELQDIRDILIEWTDINHLDIIVTTGGTGLSPRDITPEATESIIKRTVPGIAETIRIKGLDSTSRAMLSRGIAGVRDKTLIINLPGSPSAVTHGMEVILPVLKHALDKIRGDTTPCRQDGLK